MIGRAISHYRILSKLGEGGMGEVFLAEDTELGREVALKVLADDVSASPERSARFRREARAVAALNHPNIVTIHSIEESEGVRFLTMERVDGESLDRALPPDGLPLGRLFDLAIPLADALAAAHAQGIVHRDLKPANVMVTKDGRVKVLDFGLAKLAEEVDSPQERDLAHGPTRSVPLTGDGVLIGTVPYMSPEQLEGKPVDHRSDIFSLGIVLYEMATGRRPFHGESTIALASSIVRDAPRPLTEARTDAPRHLSRIVEHCLAKDPEDRFQSAKDIRNELRALREEWRSDPGEIREGTRPSGVASATMPARPSSRRALWFGLAAGVALLALAGLWLARRGSARPPSADETGPKRIAVLPFENLGSADDSYFADGMTEEVRGKLAGLAGLSVIARTSAEQYRGTTKALDQIADELGVHYLLTATVRWQRSAGSSRIRVTPELVELSGGAAPTTRWQEPFDAELSDVFRVQSDIASRVAQALEVALSGAERGRLSARPTSNVEAYDAYLRGREIETGGMSPTTIRLAAGQFEKAVALDPGFALAWARLSGSRSTLYFASGPSPALAKAAKDAVERALSLAPDLPEAYGALANYYRWVEYDLDRLREAYVQGLRIAPDDADLLRDFARVGRRSRADWEEALVILRQARDLDPRSWETARRLGEALLNLHRSVEARQEFDRGLTFAPANLTLIEFRAMTFLQEGNLASARSALAAVPKEVEPTALVAFFAHYWDLDWVLDDAQRALLLRLTPAAFDDDRSAWGIAMAQAWSRRGIQVQVEEHAEIARQALVAMLAETPEAAHRRVSHGLALAYLGQKENAVREAEQGFAQRPNNVFLKHQLARVYILVGDSERALDLVESLLDAPHYLTPAWLRIDPNFAPLRGNPRFEKLVSGA